MEETGIALQLSKIRIRSYQPLSENTYKATRHIAGCSGPSNVLRQIPIGWLQQFYRTKSRRAAECTAMIRKRLGRGVIPSVRGLCRATAVDHWGGSQSSTVCWSHPGDGTRLPNPSQNSSESCTSWSVRRQRRSRGLPTEITPSQTITLLTNSINLILILSSPQRKKTYVFTCVCLSERVLKKLYTVNGSWWNFCSDAACPKEQAVRFWWRSR